MARSKLLTRPRSRPGVPRYVIVSSIGAENPPRRRRRLQRLPAREGRGRRGGGAERPRLDGRAPRLAHRRPGRPAACASRRSRCAPASRATTSRPCWRRCLHEPRTVGLTFYVVGGDTPIERGAARRCCSARRADDRGSGGRDLGRLARARGGLRGARHRHPVSLRPLPVGLRDQRARLARRLGDDQRACRDHLQAAARHARLPRDLSPSVRAGQGRGHCRPRLGRPGGAGARHRLEPGRARGLRVPVSADGRAHEAARRAARPDLGPVGRRADPAQAPPAAPPEPDRRRPRRPAQHQARRAVRGRVQHGQQDRGRVRGDPRAARSGLRRGRDARRSRSR